MNSRTLIFFPSGEPVLSTLLCEKPASCSVAPGREVIKEPVKEDGWGKDRSLLKHPESQDEVTS